MSEKLPTHLDERFKESIGRLNDYTLLEIATTPSANPQDAAMAKAEIKRREEAGTFNPDDASEDIRRDLLGNGFGIGDGGELLYPTEEYNDWLRNREGKPPKDVVRESISNHLRQKMAEAIIKTYELNHEGRHHGKPTNRPVTQSAAPAYRPKEREPLGEQKPLGKPFEVAPPNQSAENAHAPESVEERAEELYNEYAENFSETAPKWASFGVSSLLEEGIIDPPTDSLLRRGFWYCEQNTIHERIDLEKQCSNKTIDTEFDLKTRVDKDLIDSRYNELSGDELHDAKRKGLLRAIYSGARVDSRTGKIYYSIPSERNNEITKFIAETEIDLNDPNIQSMSRNGFIGILEAIKDDKKATKKGFMALDWYFDTFGYGQHMDEFINTMDAYQECADKLFGEKLNEYLAQKEEFKQWQEQQPSKQGEAISALADARNVTQQEFISFLMRNMDRTDEGGDVSMFPTQDTNNPKNHHITNVSGAHPASNEKCKKAKDELEEILEIDPNASYAIGTVFERNSSGKIKEKSQDYALIRFGYNGFNNVIAIHIGDDSKAIFCWRGKTGDDADGWRNYFRNASIRTRDTAVKRFICRGYGKKGFSALDDQWSRIWSYLSSPDKNTDKAA